MISVISYEVNKCRKHMLLNDILQLVVLLDNYTTDTLILSMTII